MIIPLQQIDELAPPLLPNEDPATVGAAHDILAVRAEEADALDGLRVAMAPIALHLLCVERRIVLCVSSPLCRASPGGGKRDGFLR